MNDVYLAIGSNIDPEKNMAECIALLKQQWPDIRISRLYKTAPQLDEDQDVFINAAAHIRTTMSPEVISAKTKAIEYQLKKAPPHRFGPRTIDVDLLLYGDLVQNDEGLMLPHPRMHERRFVLEPLCDLIDPQTKHPSLGATWSELLEQTLDQDCSAM